MLELSDGKFKIVVVNRLKVLTEQGDNVRGQVGTLSRDMETMKMKILGK